jgi:hypothetical protein
VLDKIPITHSEEYAMPVINVYAPEGVFKPGSERALGEELNKAVLRAEGVSQPTAFQLDNRAAFLHILPTSRLQAAASSGALAVRLNAAAANLGSPEGSGS